MHESNLMFSTLLCNSATEFVRGQRVYQRVQPESAAPRSDVQRAQPPATAAGYQTVWCLLLCQGLQHILPGEKVQYVGSSGLFIR